MTQTNTLCMAPIDEDPPFRCVRAVGHEGPHWAGPRGEAFRALPGQVGVEPLVRLLKASGTAAPGFLSLFVDGGAGIGDTTQPLLDADPTVDVYAYDPLPENAAVLRERFANVPNVYVREAAISDRAGTAQFEVPSRMHQQSGSWAAGTSYSGHLRRPGFKGQIKHLIRAAQARVGLGGVDVVKVPTVRLDADLPRIPDVVKLDLQGTESIALAGLGAWFEQVKVVQAEVQLLNPQGQELAQLLGRAGFTIYLGDMQFTSKAPLTEGQRDRLAEFGVIVRQEISDTEFDVDTMVLGNWSTTTALPFNDAALTPDFVELISEFGARYCQTDLIALNSRTDGWPAILSELASQ